MREKTLWIARTGVMIALLLVLQAVTKPAGQFVTGSCVNLVLGISVIAGGFWCGFVVALLSPFFAYLLGVAAMPIVLVPGVAVGNIVLIAVLWGITAAKKERSASTWLRYIGAAAAAAAKFAALWIAVVKILLPIAGLPEAKVSALTVTFTWPQLITALIGSFLAVSISPIIMKAIKSASKK